MFAEDAGLADFWAGPITTSRGRYVRRPDAERTRLLGLGTGGRRRRSSPRPDRHSAATLHELSSGRALIGIGPGGFEFPAQFRMRPESPLSLMRDSISIIRGLLAGDANHKGRALTASGARLGWRPGPIPLFISGRGPRMIELAGES